MKRWHDVVSGAGTLVLSLLSCAVCPMCLPLYAGLLSMIGIELGNIHAFFFPLMLGFMAVTLGLMAYQIRLHHGKWRPFVAALGAAAGIGIAAFYGHEYFLYAGMALFMASIIWNKKSLSHAKQGCC